MGIREFFTFKNCKPVFLIVEARQQLPCFMQATLKEMNFGSCPTSDAIVAAAQHKHLAKKYFSVHRG
jgi:hypothetical protein